MKRLDQAGQRAASVFLAAGVVAFFLTAAAAVGGYFLELDQHTRELVRRGRMAPLEAPMRVVSTLGSGYVLLPLTAACSVVAWWRRRRLLALILPSIGGGAAIALALAKWAVNKPRPSVRGYGFPSGHVFGATVFVIIALYLLWSFDAPRRWQRTARAGGVAFVLAVGYSRLYVGAHWLSDVVGGLVAGIVFALPIVLLMDARLR